MSLETFQAFVAKNQQWFEGSNPETPDSIAAAEKSLGCVLPATLKWLLTEHGYSESCGVDSLASTVEATLRCRESIALPHRYIVLNDWNDAGVVFLDTDHETQNGEFRIAWTAAYNLNRLAEGNYPDGDIDLFLDYPAWVEDRLETFKDEAAHNKT
jgi:hypothetical protein